MPSEFQALTMSTKSCMVEPKTGDVTLTLELRETSAETCAMLTRAVVEKRDVQVIVDAEVKP